MRTVPSQRLALAMLLAGTLARILPAHAAATDDPGCGTLTIVEDANAAIYRLPHAFLTQVADSATSRRFTSRAGRDYVVDRLRGELRLLRAPMPGETLSIAACWLLQPPALEYQPMRYRPPPPAGAVRDSAAADSSAPLRPATAHRPTLGTGGASLSINGNKTIAVDFGSSQDAFLRQSLDLSVSGTLAPGIELTGVLSDRNTPLTAEGSTQDLQSLDRVLLELKTPNGAASFGDVSLSARDGEFARVDRQLQGVKAEWSARGFTGTVAAASAPGEFHRLQFFGIDGQQGPYLLTDRDGGTAITVIAGSEIVTVDGVRMTRGEGADYSVEYDRARLTFSNRRPITSASRITVDYQYTVNRYRRSFAEAGGRWDRGPFQVYTRVLTEGDDRGRPLDIAFDETDRLALSLAGDSLSRAVGTGVTAGGGDYDSVRVAGRLYYAFAGPDSGDFAVRFARVGPGQGDYTDSSGVAGRISYRYVGTGGGAFRVGQALPLPESHRLWSTGGKLQKGPLTIEAEGALSHHDLNTASAIDDGNDDGAAGRLAFALEGGDAKKFARAGLAFAARQVDSRFAPFGRLEQPFAEEDWGLPVGGDLERQRRVEASGFVTPRGAGTLRAKAATLETPGGFRAFRRALDWHREGVVGMSASWDRSDGTQDRVRFRNGGREHSIAELRWRNGWLDPALRGDLDERRTPSDTGRIAVRTREAALDLASGAHVKWRLTAGAVLRREAGVLAGGDRFDDRLEARTWRAGAESPAGAPLAAALRLERRDTRPLGPTTADRTRSDLGSLRVAAENTKRGLSGNADLEVTSEGETRRVRTPVFVGTGLGAYDALGNFVGKGDYDLAVTVLPGLERLSRAALSARSAWTFGSGDAWKGSRVEFSFESDVRRRGDFQVTDAVITPGQVRGDPAISQGSVAQRIESELAPGARYSNFRLRLERRTTGDRSFDNFAQSQQQETGELRWRMRFSGVWSAEFQGHAARQEAAQTILAGTAYARTLFEQGGSTQWIFQPGDRLRSAAVLDASWSRPEGVTEMTRTLRVGPDVSFALGARGRMSLTGRRAFITGPASVGLLPSADPAGAARWDGSANVDLRVRESTTFGLSYSVSERPGLATRSVGRAELRAFF